MVSVSRIADRITVTNYSDELPHGYTRASIDHLIGSLQAARKYVPTEFSYDDAGSVYFDQFVDSPEYYLPKKEVEIFRTHNDELAGLTGNCAIYEVGAGSSKKVKILLEAYDRRYGAVQFNPIDINAAIMIEGARHYLQTLPNVSVNCLAGAYSDVFAARFTGAGRKLMLFVGSSVSQEENDDLLASIRQQLDEGDFFLICFDLQKHPDILRSAYQNHAGAMCSLHVLDHLNATFAGDFDPARFVFEVVFNPDHGGCETHLRSTIDQVVTLRTLDLRFSLQAGESMRTGVQRKFTVQQMAERLARLGFAEVRTFLDGQGWYAAMLLAAA
tara:strand:+ start:18073 stop:19059 length:987 start_codon:yes stop_codon:yes gene_type:complete